MTFRWINKAKEKGAYVMHVDPKFSRTSARSNLHVPIRSGTDNTEVFLGRDMGHQRDYSEEIAAAIDEEVRSLIESAHQDAYEILFDNRDILDDLVTQLLEKETLDKEQVAEVFAQIRRRPARPAWTGSARRAPSSQAPVDFPVKADAADSGSAESQSTQ